MQITVPVLAKAFLACNLWAWCGIVRESSDSKIFSDCNEKYFVQENVSNRIQLLLNLFFKKTLYTSEYLPFNICISIGGA